MTILSILDTDLYKFSTSYAYMKLYPEAEGIFSFTDRNNLIVLLVSYKWNLLNFPVYH